MSDFSKNYSFKDSEKKWPRFWQQKKVYLWDKNEPRANTFVVDTPPPTVSGQLHIGHVYSYTQTDFIARFQRMTGKTVFYPMGFDDNGLPTERLVEKKQKVRASSMPRQEFVELCKKVVVSEEAHFRSMFSVLGLSVDWSLEYQTIDDRSRKISQMSFLDLVKKNEVYRNDQPMLWDPVDQTALAQADIEDKEQSSTMNDILFGLEGGGQLTIATTRPEMLPACVAVFYHPEDERYKHLQGKFALSPLFNVRVPLLPDDMVQQEKGTGLVMCCTFGDQTDILWWRKHKLPTKIILDKMGRLSNLEFKDSKASEVANEIAGFKIKDARAKIIEILKEAQLLTKQTEIVQTVKCAERSGAPLEILMTPQWFISAINHKDALMQRAQELSWHPKSMKIKLEQWINALNLDWCISRQRYFGVPFPVWYSKRQGEEGKPLFASIEQLPVDPLKDLPIGYTKDEVVPDPDIMDTWATSAVSPQLATHGIADGFMVDEDRHNKLFPVDLRPQAHEIIRTWTFYTMLKAQLHQNTLPWKNIMISGWCLAEDKSKMSKSKGNVITPDSLFEKYGADVVRYWASTSKLGADTAYSEAIIQNGKRLVNKLWNAAKFVNTHFEKLSIEDKASSLHSIKDKICVSTDQWLINSLNSLVSKAKQHFDNYEYANAMALTEQFFWSVFCDNYLEITKIRTYNQDGSDSKGQYSSILTLYHTMQILLKLFAPFIPYITEEIYQIVYSPGASIHTRGNWPESYDAEMFHVDSSTANLMLEILDLVRKAKAQDNLSIKAPIELIEVKSNTKALPLDMLEDLQNVTAAQKIEFVGELTGENQISADKMSISVRYV